MKTVEEGTWEFERLDRMKYKWKFVSNSLYSQPEMLNLWLLDILKKQKFCKAMIIVICIYCILMALLLLIKIFYFDTSRRFILPCSICIGKSIRMFPVFP